MVLKLRLSRWRCRNDECSRRIFVERFAKSLSPHAHQTNRLSEVQRLVGRAAGGRPGQRLLIRLGMPISRHTLLRQVVASVPTCALPQQAIRVLGVDDWAWRKGPSFGTILVDLERKEVVDVLPTRSAKALSQWLVKHPEVRVVSRDRHGLYAEGARSGAPKALRVADRFHLTMNLRQEWSGNSPFVVPTCASYRRNSRAGDRFTHANSADQWTTDQNSLQCSGAANRNGPATTAARFGVVSIDPSVEGRRPEGKPNRKAPGPQSTPHRQMAASGTLCRTVVSWSRGLEWWNGFTTIYDNAGRLVAGTVERCSPRSGNVAT